MTEQAVDRFTGAVLDILGFQCDPSRREFYAGVLQRRAEAQHTSADKYLDVIAAGPSPAELDALAAEITVSETYFFRHFEQLQLVLDWAKQATRPLRILCAGCSSGEEPYSLAMLLHAYTPEITAVDVNAVALHKAARARYTPWSFRETTRSLQERWFRREGDEYVLDAGIVRSVRFVQGNLVRRAGEFWRRGYYDVILCRNVIMYFRPDVAEQVVQRLQDSLAAGGHLLLGHAETLRGLGSHLRLRHVGPTFAYANGGDWVADISRRTERIHELSTESVPTTDPLGPVEELLRQERFAEALALLESIQPRRPDTELLRTALLTHSGKWLEAEAGCAKLLRAKPDDPGPRYLLALCREGIGDLQGALLQNELAAAADPHFAMPRLRMGLLYRRLQQPLQAQPELNTACGLLASEHEQRLLLYGGGFSRQTLLALCRSELKACERA